MERSPTVLKKLTSGILFLLFLIISTDALQNSTAICPGAAGVQNHTLDCGNQEINIIRLFYGVGNSSTCSARVPGPGNCIFESDTDLNELIQACKGKNTCSFPGKSIPTTGKCTSTPSTFSLVEYNCNILRKRIFLSIGSNSSITGLPGPYHLTFADSRVADRSYDCLVSSVCGTTINFTAETVFLKGSSQSSCGVDLTFQDVRTSSLRYSVKCQDHPNAIVEENWFTTQSNAARITFEVTGQMLASIQTYVEQSVPNTPLDVICGDRVHTAIASLQLCPGTGATKDEGSKDTGSVAVATMINLSIIFSLKLVLEHIFY